MLAICDAAYPKGGARSDASEFLSDMEDSDDARRREKYQVERRREKHRSLDATSRGGSVGGARANSGVRVEPIRDNGNGDEGQPELSRWGVIGTSGAPPLTIRGCHGTPIPDCIACFH